MRRFPKYKEPIQLNIGSGKNPKKDYINIDNRDVSGNMVWDIRDGLPFPDESVSKIISSHFIEHLDEDEVIDFLEEMLRILKPGCLIDILCPHATTVGAIYPGHKSLWHEDKVKAYTRSERSLPPFEIVSNAEEKGQLHFILKKSKI
jgi:predicted SAM-dependent methyltransferase